MKALTLSIFAMALAFIAGGCGQGDSHAAADQSDLDRRIPRLPVDAPVSLVEGRLGPPRDRLELEDGEISLSYNLWQLVFNPGLVARLRYYKAGYWHPDQGFTSLDHRVRRLNPGTSRKGVEDQLGKAEAWEIRNFQRREYLWYGNGRWRLMLLNQRLAAKKYTQQVTGPSRH